MTTSAQEYLDRFRSSNRGITDFSGSVYDGSITQNMPRSEVDTTESDRASRGESGGVGVNDSGKGGADFVNYFANLGNSKKEDTYEYLDKYNERSNTQAANNKVLNDAALDRNIERSIQNSYDRAMISEAMLFGDFMSKDYKAPKWENSAPKEIERPDLAGLYEQIRDDLPEYKK